MNSTSPGGFRGILFDLDGTVYAGKREIPGAAAFIQTCRRNGLRCLFVTNRSNRMPAAVAAHLGEYGIACAPKDVLTSSEATAAALPPGRAYVIGEEGLERPLRDAGFEWTDQHPDYVIVGLDRGFTYDKLRIACRCIGEGARFIATNPDRALNVENRIHPGAGALVAAIEAGTRVKPLIIGKPEPRIMEMALRRLNLCADEALAVGDNLETDIPAGAAAGIRTALLLTGVSTAEEAAAAAPAPMWVCADYADLARRVFGPSRKRG